MKKLLCAVCLVAASAGVSAIDLAGSLRVHGQFKHWLQVVEAAGLLPLLSQAGPYTVFAPSDEAFAALPPERIAALLKPAARAELVRLVGLHIVSGAVGADAWRQRRLELRSAAGMLLVVEQAGEHTMVNESRALRLGQTADNGVIHVIDRVLLPPDVLATQ